MLEKNGSLDLWYFFIFYFFLAVAQPFLSVHNHPLYVMYRTSMVLWKSLFIWVWRGFSCFICYLSTCSSPATYRLL